MKAVGYGDQLSVEAGGRIGFKVSCSEPAYEATLVQPSHVPALHRELDAPLNGTHPGREQKFQPGSFVKIEQPVPRPTRLRLETWIFPTAPDAGPQEILAWDDGDGLFVGAGGDVELRANGAVLASGVPLRRAEWVRLTAEIAEGRATLSQVPRRWDREVHVAGALAARPAEGTFRIGRGFDGKIDAPRIIGVAAWDFSVGIRTMHITDTGPAALHGTIVNMPMRGVTGWNWTGRSTDYTQAPSQYGAIHFHRDDLEDAGWDTDFAFDVPEELDSGLYAIRLRAGGAEDHIPFFVRPRPGREAAKIAFLAPVFSYLAYSCETSSTAGTPGLSEQERAQLAAALLPEDRYAADTGLLSLYDHHKDGTGCCFVSRLRPLPNMRPFYKAPPIRGVHQLGADLHVIDWLRSRGEPFEILTDEELHARGREALAPYRAVLSGTHPEYWSGPMLDGVERFLEGGGRFMYLGGNGMYWVTDPHPERPHVVEVRRTHAGSRAWNSAPGECVQQTTGEPSGLWRYRGRPSHATFGIGMAGMGFDAALPYRRSPESHDATMSWIFDGVGSDETIGSFGAVLGGAGGFEIDSLDPVQGSPPGTVLLASATGFSDTYQGAVENVMMEDGQQGASRNAGVRADMTYLPYPNGGAVFATGSICWGTSLMHNRGSNNVATITDNVLRRFAQG